MQKRGLFTFLISFLSLLQVSLNRNMQKGGFLFFSIFQFSPNRQMQKRGFGHTPESPDIRGEISRRKAREAGTEKEEKGRGNNFQRIRRGNTIAATA